MMHHECQRKRPIVEDVVFLSAGFTTVERGAKRGSWKSGAMHFDVAYREVIGEAREEVVGCFEGAFVVAVGTEGSSPESCASVRQLPISTIRTPIPSQKVLGAMGRREIEARTTAKPIDMPTESTED